MISHCSNLFMNTFDSNCSGILRTCECGITWFNSEEPDILGVKELESLLEKTKSNPEMYIETDHYVRSIIIDGKEIVWDCNCNIAQEYEKFIKDNAIQIAEYLNGLAEIHRKHAGNIEVKNTNEVHE